jgi:hypothetical protein
MFLRDVGSYKNHKAKHPRRRHSANKSSFESESRLYKSHHYGHVTFWCQAHVSACVCARARVCACECVYVASASIVCCCDNQKLRDRKLVCVRTDAH